jgi:excisionase family DNA binding protein
MIGAFPEDTVVMDAHTADALAILARTGLAELRRLHGGQIPPTFGEAVARLDRVIDGIAAARTGPVTDHGRPPADTGASSEVPVAEAATRLGRTERTVTRWLAEGKLTGRRVGRLWLVDSRSLADHLEDSDAAA